MRLAIVVALAACAPRGLSVDDRGALDDLRAVDAVAVDAIATAMRQYEGLLTDAWDVGPRVPATAKPWREMRARVEPVRLRDAALDALVDRYLAERDEAWSALEQSLVFGARDEAAQRDRYRTFDRAATATWAAVEARLASLELPPAPAVPPDAGVVLAPPPAGPSGPAFFLSGDTAIALDATGFHPFATDVGFLHVAEDGTAFACGTWKIVRWSSGVATEVKPPIYNQVCGVAPDGTLWIGDYVGEPGKLARYDGQRWEIWKAPFDDGTLGMEQLVIARDGTVFGRTSRTLLVLEHRQWRVLADPAHRMGHIFLGGDGNAWALLQTQVGDHYPEAVFPLRASGVGPAVWTDDHFQTSRLWGSVDARGTATIYDARKNLNVQGAQGWRLPAPNPYGQYTDHPGGFAYDAAGRIWVDLVDGLNVFERDGTRHVRPIGSIDAIRKPISQLFVVGAGPPLPRRGVAPTRTITATLARHPNVDVMFCVPWIGDPPCGKGPRTWTARTDATGRFELHDVPRYALHGFAFLGARGAKYWQPIERGCCGGDATVLELEVEPPPRF